MQYVPAAAAAAAYVEVAGAFQKIESSRSSMYVLLQLTN